MLLAINEDGKIVHAKDVDKGQTYICPTCNEEVILKKGSKKIHHFAHKIDTQCSNNDGESAVHKYFKDYVAELKEVDYNGQMMQITHSEVEKRLTDGLIADVLLILDGWKSIAVEICYKHAKDEEHIQKYKDLNLECYEIYVDMNAEQTDFEIIDWKCLSSLEMQISSYETEIALLKGKISSYQTEILDMVNQWEQEIKQLKDDHELDLKLTEKSLEQRHRNMINDMKKEYGQVAIDDNLKKWTGCSANQLAQFYQCNTGTGKRFYFLEMSEIINNMLYDNPNICSIKLYIKDVLGYDGSQGLIYDIEFIDENRHILDKIKDVKSTKKAKDVLKKRFKMSEYGKDCGVRRDKF